MKFHGSFGGPQTLITSVTIKCNEFGEPDIVSIIYNPQPKQLAPVGRKVDKSYPQDKSLSGG